MVPSYTCEAIDWSMRSKVSKIAIIVLMTRCEYILNKFLVDKNDLAAFLKYPYIIAGEQPLPKVRIDEIVYVLQELARLVIHSETVSALQLHSYLKEGLHKEENHESRAHLLILFPSFCELVISRETRVRELVLVLLRLISANLGLEKVNAG
ncbi:hypothetical protein GIB67_012096 [Kingdonia uniflora]|uniref:Uncharacterized protein n=1 Tax=Kingdonia uniflora TaxID=39325 RepID=A0A7J7LHY4_9MAGN|nr:hypothetical protein GIB67_012096 [Kingdonia uniflora]